MIEDIYTIRIYDTVEYELYSIIYKNNIENIWNLIFSEVRSKLIISLFCSSIKKELR